MKKILTLLLICLLSLVYSENYIQKYSSSSSWQGLNGNGNIAIHGNKITEITIVNKTDTAINAHLRKTLTPYSQVIDSDFTMNLQKDKFVFNFIDNFGNLVEGYFRYNQYGAAFFIECIKLQEDAKSLNRLYDGFSQLSETTNDPSFFIRAIELSKEKLLLNSINAVFWPNNGETLIINYIGKCDQYLIYTTDLIWGESKRSTRRLVLFDSYDNYQGHFYGMPVNDILIINKTIVFSSINKKDGNIIDLNNNIPSQVYIDGENLTFQK